MSSSLKIKFLGLCYLLCSLGAGLAQAAEEYTINWYTLDSGGITSEGGDYSVTGTIGQLDAGSISLSNEPFSIQGGFWSASIHLVQSPSAPTLTIEYLKKGVAQISWSLGDSDWVLQKNNDLSEEGWSDTASLESNPVKVPSDEGRIFYRLILKTD